MQNLSQFKFNVLSEIKSQLSINIKLFYIFGETGNEVIIVTNDDKVLSFGSNKTGLLGLGHNNPTTEPSIVEELCDKQVVDFSSGFNHVMAVTKCGQLYTWGSNSFGELGNETQVANYKPIINKTLSENNIKVMKMSCGYSHSIVFTNTAEMYGFGRNDSGQVGCGDVTHQLTPIKISHEAFNSDKVKSISCGAYHSLALTDSGKVYIWGYNADGRLGIESWHQSKSNQYLPIIIDSISNTIIKKISGGSTHSMLLSSDGSIYTFGVNSFGQIGNGNQVNQIKPNKLNKTMEFADIATDFSSSLSIATSVNGICYVWGDCVKGVVTTPKETIFTSIHDIYAFYSKRKITYIPINIENEISSNRFINKIADLFNNSENSDIKLNPIQKRIIYLYEDSGVGSESLLQTRQTLEEIVGQRYLIKTLNASAISAGGWRDNAALLVMPGGADLPYAKKLKGIGNRMIKAYVQQGGSYLGICAGAYYASAWIEFDRGGPLAVCGRRALQFFPGKAIGPMLSAYDYQSNSGACIANIAVHLGGSLKILNLLFNGGPYFSEATNYPHVSVIGCYKLPNQQTEPAILFIQYGQGSVVLSGVHLEYSEKLMNNHDPYLAPLLPGLAASAADRQLLVHQLLSRLKLDIE